MSANTQDELLRSYVSLNSLKQNLPEGYEVEQRWVDEYHQALAKIEGVLAISLAEFKLSPSDLQQSVATSNYMTGEVRYRAGLWCERAILMQKLDAVLMYFSMQQGEGSRKIGFAPPS